MRPVVVCVVGTRPEAIKMAPLILRLRRRESELETRLVTSGQHRDLLDRALEDFGLTPDTDLDLMRPDQGLAELTAWALVGLSEYLERERPAFVLRRGYVDGLEHARWPAIIIGPVRPCGGGPEERSRG
ncbi:MAG: UDP-N-acetylglucosamine 2-epimerase [Singulisphaera sp.]